MNHIEQFSSAMRAAGLEPPGILDDGELHRFSTNGKAADTSGWYVLHGDGVPAGRFGCFRSGLDESFQANVERRPTAEERIEVKRRIEAAKRVKDVEVKALRESAKTKAKALWSGAGAANGHAYLARKEVPGDGIKESGGVLLVPVYDQSKDLVGLQRIFADGEKRFLYGTPAAGGYTSIGKDAARLAICEGWATGMSIHLATGMAVIVAFNAGNMMAIAKMMRDRYPNSKLIIAADNDLFTDGNPGLTAGRAAAEAVKAPLFYPVFSTLTEERPTDFNDLHRLAGLEAVAAVFNPAPEPATPVEQEPAPEPVPPVLPVSTHAAAAPMALPVSWKGLELATLKSGALVMNLDNAVRAVEGHPDIAGHIWYDEFLDSIVTDWQGPERKWADSDDIKLALFLQRHVLLARIGTQAAHDAAMVAAMHDVRNECRSWVTSTPWDKVDRLAYLMCEGFGAAQNPYTEAVGRCWIMSMVARVMRPGCKVDTVPVFEGIQGSLKSSGLAILGGKWFVEAHEPATSKDFFDVLRGHMLVEISEMHSFSRAEVERIKGVISCQKDRYRKAYGRNTEDHPRIAVLACTTNRDDWQKDDTGARRFWPVACGTVDLDWLARNRDQLFAEALDLFHKGVPWWDVPVAAQQGEVESRREIDPWEETITDWLGNRGRVQLKNILNDCLQIDIAKQDRVAMIRVGRILRCLGWGKHVLRDDGKAVKTWVKH